MHASAHVLVCIVLFVCLRKIFASFTNLSIVPEGRNSNIAFLNLKSNYILWNV